MKTTRHAPTFTLVTLSLLLLTCAAAPHGGARATAAAPGRCGPSWWPLTRSEFSAQMPGRVRPEPSLLPGGESMPGEMYRASSGGVVYTLWVVADDDPGLGDRRRLSDFQGLFLNSLSSSAGARATARLTGEVSLNGFAGRQLEVRSGGARSALNLYARGDRVYALWVTPLDGGTPAAECFLNSFSLSGSAVARRVNNPPPPRLRPERPTPTPTPAPTPTPTPTPAPTPRPGYFACDCGEGLFEEVPGDANNHDLAVCPYPQMDYPNLDRKEGNEGTGKLLVHFPAYGPPVVLEVIQGLTKSLTQSAINAVQATKFCPRVVNGVRQDVKGEMPFTFELITAPATPPPVTRPGRP